MTGPGTMARHGPLRTTPSQVLAWAALAIVVAITLGVVTANSAATITSGFTRMGGTEAPLVEASTSLYFAVNDMDAQVANVLLAGSGQAFAASRQSALSTYTRDRMTADASLRMITATAAGDPRAQAEVGTVLDALGRYEALAANAIQLDALRNDPPGRPSAGTRTFFEQATDLMRGVVLPAATGLTRANSAALTTSYAADRRAAHNGGRYLYLLGFLLIAVLAGLQAFMARRYRRLVSPALALATIVALAVTIIAAGKLGDQYRTLRAAESDAFGSVLALTQARAISYDANADESRYLVDAARAGQYQDSFLAKSRQIADVGGTVFQYDAALAREIGAYRASNANVEFGGFLGQEFRNITFPGERAAAERALLAWQAYQRADRTIRRLAATDQRAAIAFDVGSGRGQSDWAFSRFDGALQDVITLNEDAFTKAVAAGHDEGSGWDGPVPAIVVLVIAGLVLAGAWRRVTEYR